MRWFAAGLTVLMALSGLQAGDDGLAGQWKFSVYEEASPATFWLVRFDNDKGKWSAAATPLRKLPSAKIDKITVDKDLVTFDIRLENGIVFEFEGKLPSGGGKKIHGSFARGNQAIPAVLEPTTAKNAFEFDREVVARFPNDPRVFAAVLELIPQAKMNKASPGDVRDWVETALAAAEAYGPRWKNDLSLKLFDRLLASEGYAIAAELGRKLDKGLDPKASDDLRMRLWDGMATALRRTGQAEQAQQVETKLDALLIKGYDAHNKKAIEFPVEMFKGRKAKGNRAVLVELFTGAMCPPCVASDIGFDALGKAFPTTDVVLLQYHIHVPGPDALTNTDTEARQEFYGKSIRGTPTILFNGRPGAPGGGGREDAEDKFKEYRALAEKLLEKEGGIDLQASAVRKGDKIHIQAGVKNLENPGKDVRLRLVLVEDWVRYQGRNGLTYHHRVVRAMPGGADGLALTKKEGETAVVVDLDDLRKKLHKYLDDFQEKETTFPDAQRPMRFRDFHVVAFVQNDESGEVLHAVNVAVKKGAE